VDAALEELKVELVRLLLTKEADVNAVTQEGDTALHFVCEQVQRIISTLKGGPTDHIHSKWGSNESSST
jgi:hypothetical protein